MFVVSRKFHDSFASLAQRSTAPQPRRRLPPALDGNGGPQSSGSASGLGSSLPSSSGVLVVFTIPLDGGSRLLAAALLVSTPPPCGSSAYMFPQWRPSTSTGFLLS